jgi:hypothetical protein
LCQHMRRHQGFLDFPPVLGNETNLNGMGKNYHLYLFIGREKKDSQKAKEI